MRYNPETFASADDVAELLGLSGRHALYRGTATRKRLDALGMPQPLPYRKRGQLWMRKHIITFRDLTLAVRTGGAAVPKPQLVAVNDPAAAVVAERMRDARR